MAGYEIRYFDKREFQIFGFGGGCLVLLTSLVSVGHRTRWSSLIILERKTQLSQTTLRHDVERDDAPGDARDRQGYAVHTHPAAFLSF